MKENRLNIRARVWLYQGQAGWHFVTLPKKESDFIKEIFGPLQLGWGSISVKVTLGKTTWKTSIFRDKKSEAYLLPLKTEIRKKENISVNDIINFIIEIEL